MKSSHKKAWQVFFAVLLLTDGVAGQVWRHQPRAARSIQKFEFTEAQKTSLTNEVSCQFMGKYNEASNQVGKMNSLMNAMDKYDQLMGSEDEKLAGLQSGDSYKAHQILHEEQNQQCQANFTAMHTSCNTCIMGKCQDYYRNNCASLEPDPMEIIEPPCKTRPDSPCEEPERTDQSIGSSINRTPPRPGQDKPATGLNIQITVNGESVPTMTEAMEMIKTTMTQKVRQPEADCEPGSQFAEFKEVVSPVSRSSSYQVSMSSSGGSPSQDTGAAMGSMDSLTDMMQNENAKVHFNANINGKEIECDSYECIKQHQETLDQMSRFNDLWKQRAGSFNRDGPQRGDSSGGSHFSYSMSGSSGSGPRTSSSSFRMSSSNKGANFPQAQSLGSSMTGSCSECGGCGQQQRGSAAFRPSSVANDGPCGFQERSEVGHGRDLFAEVRRDLATLGSDGSGNGKMTENGQTFSYSWQGSGQMPENLEDILNLGLSGLNRQRSQMRSSCNSGRCTRNLRSGLARSRRYYPTKTRRAVSQCAIEQAAKEAAERARQEEARRLSELARQGGYNSACSMLNSQHGEAQTNMMVTQLLTNLKSELGRATQKCMASGNCHNTRVHINVVGRTNGSGCNPDDSNSPCNQEQSLYEQSRNKINEWRQQFNISINGSGSKPTPSPTQAPVRPVYPETAAPRLTPARTTPGRNAPVQPGSDSSSSPVDNNREDYSAYYDSDYFDSPDDQIDSEFSDEYSDVVPDTMDQNPAEWAIWGSWSSCDINCANSYEKGTQVRHRDCEVDRQKVSIPRENCNHGDDVQYRECLPVPKPCNTWAHWGFWTECSASCGAGTRERTRSCMYGGECQGQKTQVEACTNLIHPDCPTWSDWQIAAECSVTCGQGVRSYFRTCQNGRINEPGCVGPAARQEPCDTGRKCALWTQWCEWSGCSATCGQGDQVRERQCVNGEPGDPGCEGRANERKICNAEQRACPEWTPWSEFTVCSVTCGDGVRTRVRDCRNGNIGDDGCIGEPEDTVECEGSRQCPFWSIWGSFSSCSVTCGEGERTRTRECVYGREGEIGCEGSSVDMSMCYGARRECEYWSEWSEYGECSVTCDQGTSTRTRECINGRPGDVGCPGSDFEAIPCEEEACIRYVEYEDPEPFPVECDENPDFGEPDNQEPFEQIEIEHREDEPFVMPPAPQTKDQTPPQDITCGGILEQDSEQCSSLFQESCQSCDSSLSSVCSEYYSIKVQMEQLHHEMKQCEARKKFYAERKAELNIQYMELQQNVNENHQWALNMAVSLIPADATSPAEYPPCDIRSATVQPEPSQFGFTISVVAKMNVTPWSEIRIDMDFNQPFSNCCSSRQTMARTRRSLGNRLMLKLRQISERNTPMSYP